MSKYPRSRTRSRSPVELFPEKVKNASVELFPEKVSKATVELFPERVSTGRGFKRDGSPPRLFSADDPIEAPMRGQSPPRRRLENRVELFPEKLVDRSRSGTPRSLADRIDSPRSNSTRPDDIISKDIGVSIRGSAGGGNSGLNFKGAAQSAGTKNAGIELIPQKSSNSLFDRISDAPAPNRRGPRRQRAEDLFG